jgi:hypothetical protein
MRLAVNGGLAAGTGLFVLRAALTAGLAFGS